MNYLALLAEFFGTFLFIVSILATGNALIVGLTLSLIIFLIGGVSGGYVNPAVSFAMFFNGALTIGELVAYWTAELAGGAAAVYVFNALA